MSFATTADTTPAQRTISGRHALEILAWLIAATLIIVSAIFAKENGATPALVKLDSVPSNRASAPTDEASPVTITGTEEIVSGEVRWFNGRMVRPARTLWMEVTAYSPDHRSCGHFADGQTSTLHSVWTNGMKLVAADTRILPFGSMITVPGYDDGNVVPVLDRGGAIKGHKLDLLFPTHDQARKWGRQKLKVVVWEYADGSPLDNPRELR
ncbi:MAG: 3D domain-containing protein [Planctomycetota bacterium]